MKRLLFCIIFLLTFSYLFTQSVFQYPYQKVIHYTFTLTNPTDRMIENIIFKSFAPMAKSSTMAIEKTVCPIPFTVETDSHRNRTLVFEIDRMVPYQSIVIPVKVILRTSKTPNSLSGIDTSRYLGQETLIESDSPEIASLAKKLKADSLETSVKNSSSSTLKNIYIWVLSNIDGSVISGEDKGALYAYQKKRGDCSEHAYLVCALARANNIPARVMGGFYTTKNGRLKPSSYHNWTEVFIDGTWDIVDSHGEIYRDKRTGFIPFKVLDHTDPGFFQKFICNREEISIVMQ